VVTPLGIAASQIARETRVITACDFFDALTANRPYRGPMPVDEALSVMRAEVGSAIDPVCFAALETSVAR
jgi:HD-GYP domain-containing protein (c-di-GMP phosphodiesterase class II)